MDRLEALRGICVLALLAGCGSDQKKEQAEDTESEKSPSKEPVSVAQARLRECGLISDGPLSPALVIASDLEQVVKLCIEACLRAASCEQLTPSVCDPYALVGPVGAFGTCEMSCVNPATTECADESTLYTAAQRCDGHPDCLDASDEAKCPSFACDGDRMLTTAFVCDGVLDCNDGADEQGCMLVPTTFRCAKDLNIVSSDQLCDLHWDCVDGSDESGCAKLRCPTVKGYRACKSGEQVPDEAFCNGSPDCVSGEDEKGCTAVTSEGFQCLDGATVSSSSECDGFPDCDDSSDESDCESL